MHNLYCETLDIMPDNICIIDSKGIIIYVNAAWGRFAKENGAEPEEVGVGINYMETLRRTIGEKEMPQEAIQSLQGLQAIINGKSAFFPLEYPCHSPNKQRWFRMEARPLSGGQFILISHIDVTLYKEEAGKLQQEINILVERNDSLTREALLGRWLSGILHDWSHVLMMVNEPAVFKDQLATIQEVLSEEQRSRLAAVFQRMLETCDHLESVFRMGIEWSRIISRLGAKQQTPKTPQLFSKLIEKLLLIIKNELERNEIRLVVDLDDYDPLIKCDQSEMLRIFFNLVVNAVYSMRGENIRVLTIQLRVKIRDERIHFRIMDTGIGIPEEKLPHIFEKGFTTKMQEGMGLGLSEVAVIVQDHEGEITVESKVGKGTSFLLIFPLFREA